MTIKGKDLTPKRPVFNIWVFLLLLFLGYSLMQRMAPQTQSIPYSEFEQKLKDGKVSDLVITDKSITGKVTEDSGARDFVTTRVEPDLAGKLSGMNVKYRAEIEDTFLREMISLLLPIALFFGIWMFIMRRAADKQGLGGGFMGVGKSKAKVYIEEKIKTSFADVAGVDEAKVELQEIIQFLKDPGKYSRLGGKMPKGILLVGPPGTGKTLLARAVAGEAGVPFFFISGSEFVEMFVGVGAARVRDLFDQASKKAPCIIFIDELDAMGRARGLGQFSGGGHDEKEQTLNQLLVELDGFDPRQGVVLLAATNRPEILDPALLRAGRFDRQVLVDRPDKKSREQILLVHMKKVKLAETVSAEQVAALTPGFTGADLANLVNEAALLATRRDAVAIEMHDFNDAVERLIAGLEKKNRILNEHERKVVAYHEMGHAIVAMATPGSDPVHKVSIIPRGVAALGYTIQRPVEDRFLMSKAELESKMAVYLGGRAAESIIFQEISTGAADDLSRVTDIARSMVTRYGMGTTDLGMVAYENEPRSFLNGPYDFGGSGRKFSEETAREIDCAVRDMVAKAYERAIAILKKQSVALETGAQQLLGQETLNASELPVLAT